MVAPNSKHPFLNMKTLVLLMQVPGGGGGIQITASRQIQKHTGRDIIFLFSPFSSILEEKVVTNTGHDKNHPKIQRKQLNSPKNAPIHCRLHTGNTLETIIREI